MNKNCEKCETTSIRKCTVYNRYYNATCERLNKIWEEKLLKSGLDRVLFKHNLGRYDISSFKNKEIVNVFKNDYSKNINTEVIICKNTSQVGKISSIIFQEHLHNYSTHYLNVNDMEFILKSMVRGGNYRGQDLIEIRNKINSCDLLIIDGLRFYRDQALTDELSYIVNKRIRSEKSVIILTVHIEAVLYKICNEIFEYKYNVINLNK
jgi:hypothetical protein